MSNLDCDEWVPAWVIPLTKSKDTLSTLENSHATLEVDISSLNEMLGIQESTLQLKVPVLKPANSLPLRSVLTREDLAEKKTKARRGENLSEEVQKFTGLSALRSQSERLHGKPTAGDDKNKTPKRTAPKFEDKIKHLMV